MQLSKHVLLVGGAGYVGAELQKSLVDDGYQVSVLDTFWYPAGRWAVNDPTYGSKIKYLEGDVRDTDAVSSALAGSDLCIHLACISNDPSYELDPDLAKSINYEAFKLFVDELNKSTIERVIFASSSSVYGVKTEPEVTENLTCEPLTDYSRYKVACEEILFTKLRDDISSVVVRPSTVCGVSKRQRFDLVVNVLAISALTKGVITVDGGGQYRPNLHITDMVDSYRCLLSAPSDTVNREIFNVAGANLTVLEIAETVREVLGGGPSIEIREAFDQRSYRVSGAKLKRSVGFVPQRTVRDAVAEIAESYARDEFSDINALEYYNIRRMKQLLEKGK